MLPDITTLESDLLNTSKKTKSTQYNASQIKVITGLDHIRQRPGMYVGSTGEKGLHCLIWEIVDNSTDEVTNGYGSHIDVVIHKDNSVTISDDGRGIPVDIHPTGKKPAVQLIFEVPGAGGKFDNEAYEISGGLHGVGASVVNALSKWVKIHIQRDGLSYELTYNERKLVKPGLVLKGPSVKTGTSVTFMPDSDIFETTEFNYSTIFNRIRQLAFLNSGIVYNFTDERSGKTHQFFFKGGLKEFVSEINENKETVHSNPICLSGSKEGVRLDVVLQFTTGYTENIYSFVNNIPTTDGGTHDTGFRVALTRAINEAVKLINTDKKRGKIEYSFQGMDTTEGLTAVISVKTAKVQFEGQTKTKLGNSNIKGLVTNIVYENLIEYFKTNRNVAKSIISRIQSAYESREAAKKAKEIYRKKNSLTANAAVGKIANCSSKDPGERELFIVEGESAGGNAKQGRNRRFQAVLPLKGKPLNVEKKSIKEILENEELATLIACVGAGIGSDFDISQVQYNKINIATDADDDGDHIKLILLTFFYRYMRPLIEHGYVYIAVPPLYKVSYGTKYQYIENDEKLQKFKEKVKQSYTIQRYKGLGEMNPDQLWETTMNPETRTLIRVTIADAVAADELFSVLMGSKTEPRRRYIEQWL